MSNATAAPTTAAPTARPTTLANITPATIAGINALAFVVMVVFSIVAFVCLATYPALLISRWRFREKVKLALEEEEDRADEEDDGDDDDDDDDRRRRKKRRGGGGGWFGGGKKKKKDRGDRASIFQRGRGSVRGKWVERTDPESGQPYYEHTGTGEVRWEDPRPQKRAKPAPRGPPPGPAPTPVSQGSMSQMVPARGPPCLLYTSDAADD